MGLDKLKSFRPTDAQRRQAIIGLAVVALLIVAAYEWNWHRRVQGGLVNVAKSGGAQFHDLKERLTRLENITGGPTLAEFRDLKERVEHSEDSNGVAAQLDRRLGRIENALQFIFISMVKGRQTAFAVANEQHAAVLKSFFPPDRFAVDITRVKAPAKKKGKQTGREPASSHLIVTVKPKG